MTLRIKLPAVAATIALSLGSTGLAHGTTYTLEPWDFDGVFGIVHHITQLQLGGSLCPCVKIPYPADYLHNDVGVAGLAAAPLQPGDTVMGFSNGVEVVSAYLAGHTPPPGVSFVLLGDTFERNAQLVQAGRGVPADVSVPVTLVVNQYDGYSDFPTEIFSPGYLLAAVNAIAGMFTVHNYVSAQLDNPANVVTTRGNITAVLVPTQNLPINRPLRMIGLSWVADPLDHMLRPLIDGAYAQPGPTPDQFPRWRGISTAIASRMWRWPICSRTTSQFCLGRATARSIIRRGTIARRQGPSPLRRFG